MGRAPSEGGNGVAEPGGVVLSEQDGIDTGPIRGQLAAALNEPGALDAIMEAAVKATLGGGSGGDGKHHPPKTDLSKGAVVKIMAIVLTILSGGGLTTYYMTVDRAQDNELAIEKLIPRVESAEGDVRYIKATIKETKTSVEKVRDEQKAVLSGIEELKKENVKKLQDELSDAKTELRRERWRNRRR